MPNDGRADSRSGRFPPDPRAIGRPGRDDADPGAGLTGAELIVAPVRMPAQDPVSTTHQKAPSPPDFSVKSGKLFSGSALGSFVQPRKGSCCSG